MAGETVEISNTAPVGQTTMAGSNPVTIASDQSAVPVSVSGVSTAAKQDTQTVAIGLLAVESGGVLAAILAKIVSAPALDSTLAAANTLLTAIKALLPVALVGGRLDVNIGASAITQPVSGAVTVTGGALEAGHLATIDTSTASSATAQATTNTKLAGGLPVALGGGGGVKVDGSGTALPVSAAVLPLPALAATSTLQGAGLPSAFGAGGGVKVDGSGTALPVSVAALPALTTGSATIGAVTGPGASALATSAAQTTAQTSLSSLDAKIPALGQALAVAAVPVVLTAIQVAALAQDRITAGAPSAIRISADGTNFVDSTHPVRTDPTGTTAQPITDNSGSITIDSPQLPSALAANGGLKIEGVASGVAVPVSLASVPSHAVTVAQLASALGQQLTANSPSFAPARGTTLIFASVPTAGLLLATGPGIGYAVQFDNNTGSAVFLMVFDATTTRPNGTQALWKGATIASGASSTFQLGGNVAGLPFVNGLWLQFSSTQGTLTAIASTAIIGTYNGA